MTDFINLTDGLPQMAYVRRGEYVYFTYNLTDPHDFTVSLSTMSGDADVYVSTHGKPSSANYTWKHIDFGSDVLKIKSSDNGYIGKGTYYIAVKGFTNSLFDVMIYHNASKFMKRLLKISQQLLLYQKVFQLSKK
jgi:hypothetical protein